MNRLGPTFFAVLTSSLAVFSAGGIAQAQIFASGTGYTDSVTAVSGSPWTYGTESDLTGAHLTPFDTPYYFTVDSSYNGLGDPTYPPGDNTTLIGLGNFSNDSRVQYDPHAVPITAGSEILPPLTVTLRQDSGSSTLDPYMRFTAGSGGAGSSGLFDVSASFLPSDLPDFNANSGYQMTYSIVLNNASGTYTLLSDTITGGSVSAPVTFNQILSLNPGDTVDFVESNALGNPVSTSNVDATFEAIPEPSTWALLFAGITVMAFAGRRPKSAASRYT